MREMRKKITVEVSEELLMRARVASGDSLTETVRQGLRLVAAGQAFESLRAKRGTIRFSRPIEALRDDRE